MIFDRDSILNGAALNPAPGVPATAGERAGIDAEVFAETQMSLSASNALFDRYEEYTKEIREATGVRVSNPMGQRPDVREKAERRLQKQLLELRETNPDLVIRSPEDIRRDIAEERANLRERQADVQRRTIDWPASAAGFAAQAGTAVTDPPVLASMFFGAPYATGVLRGALVEGGIGALSEIPVQLAVQSGRRQFGEEPSLSEGLSAIGLAGVGGAAISTAIRGAFKGGAVVARNTRDLIERSRGLPNRSAEVRAAEDYLSRQAAMEESSPFDNTPAGRAEHAERISEADIALREGRSPDMDNVPKNPVRVNVERVEPLDVPDPIAEIGRVAREAAEIDERGRVAVEIAALDVTDPDRVATLFRQLKGRQEKPETLLSFLNRTGGLQDFEGELRALGLTPRARPGLLRKNGQTLDDATRNAWENGFFPSHVDRPEIDDLLEAIRQELSGQPVTRGADDAVLAEQAVIDELNESLIDAGVDVRKLRQSEFVPRLREAAKSVIARDAERDIRQGRMARMSKAGAEADDIADIDAALIRNGGVDPVAEADVRQRYEGREGETLSFETDDGLQRQTVREMFEEFDTDAEDLGAFQVCARGL